MGRDTPVIITDRCGIASQIKDRAGLVVPYDEDALAGAIRSLVDDPALREGLAEGGRRVLEEEFSWEPVVADLEALYARAVSGEAR